MTNKNLKNPDLNRDLAYGITRIMNFMRAKENLTQATLSESLSMKREAISRIEHGQHLPSLKTLLRIADLLRYKIQIRFTSEADGTVIDSDGYMTRPDPDRPEDFWDR